MPAATKRTGSPSRSAATSSRRASSNGGKASSRASSNGSKASPRASSNGGKASGRGRNSRAATASARRPAKSRAGSPSRASSRSRPTKTAKPSAATRVKDVGGSAMSGVGKAAKNAAVPVATAALGAAAGFILERRQRGPRKVLGIPIPGTSSGMNGVAKEIHKAGKQFGKLASEVQTTRKKAEGVGKALS